MCVSVATRLLVVLLVRFVALVDDPSCGSGVGMVMPLGGVCARWLRIGVGLGFFSVSPPIFLLLSVAPG